MVLDDVLEEIEEPNFNHPNTSPDPPSPYADLEKKYRKNKNNNKKKNYYPELFGTRGLGAAEQPKTSDNKTRNKKATKTKRKSAFKPGHLSQKKQQGKNV